MAVKLTLDHWLSADRRVFNTKKKYIQGALQGETGIIDGVTEDNKEAVFYMLMFCLCVPQSKAVKAEEAIDKLREQNFYSESISFDDVVKNLIGKVRFHSVKAKRLMEAKTLFEETDFWNDLSFAYRSHLINKSKDISLQNIRNFLISNVNGMGMKLSGHFMRNIGIPGLAILDVHVIGGLYKRNIIDNEKLGSSKTEYLQTEEIMKGYAQEVGITLDELDLLLWSQKTGYVFK